MAGTLIGALRVALGLDTAQFETGANAAERRALQLGERIGSALRAPIDGAKALNGALLALGGSAVIAAAARALDYASSLGETAQQLGVTTKALQTYRYIASQVGIEQEAMDKGLAKLTLSIGQAAAGVDKPAKAFQQLGVSITDSNGKMLDAGEVIPRVADALAKIHDPAARAAIEVALFGKAGQQLDTMLAGGGAQINALAAAAEHLGIVLSDDQIAHADEAADKISELKMVLEANIAGAVADNASAIYDLANSIGELIAKLPAAVNWLMKLKDRLAIASDFAKFGAALQSGDANEAVRVANLYVADRADLQRRSATPTWSKQLSGSASDYLQGMRRSSGALPVADGDRAKAKAAADKAAREAEQARKKAAADQRAYDADLGRTRSQEIAAREQLTPEIVEQSALARERLAIDQAARRQAIETNDRYSAAQKAELLAIEARTAAVEYDAINRRENETLAKAALAAAQAGNDNETDLLKAQEALATTAKERRAIELRLLDLQYDSERAQQEAIIASHDSTAAERGIAQRRIAAMGGIYGAQRITVMHDTAGPLETYLRGATSAAGDMNEALENVAVDGLQALNSGLADALSGAKSLGSVFKSVANSILADIARIAAQKLLSNLFGSLLGGGTYTGVNLTGFSTGTSSAGILSDFAGARAGGGPVTGGRDYLVGERGPEIFTPDTSGTIIANDNLGGYGGSRVTQHITVTAGVDLATRSEVARFGQAVKAETIRALDDRRRRGG